VTGGFLLRVTLGERGLGQTGGGAQQSEGGPLQFGIGLAHLFHLGHNLIYGWPPIRSGFCRDFAGQAGADLRLAARARQLLDDPLALFQAAVGLVQVAPDTPAEGEVEMKGDLSVLHFRADVKKA